MSTFRKMKEKYEKKIREEVLCEQKIREFYEKLKKIYDEYEIEISYSENSSLGLPITFYANGVGLPDVIQIAHTKFYELGEAVEYDAEKYFDSLRAGSVPYRSYYIDVHAKILAFAEMFGKIYIIEDGQRVAIKISDNLYAVFRL